jgi:Ca-activated chloride channel family protein
MWQTKNQQAQTRLEEGDALGAAELFEDGEWQAVSRYRGGEFAESAAKFAAKGDTRNLYNLGNAMAKQGEFESALDAYEQVLEMEPDNADAKYNRDLTAEMLQEQEAQQQEGESQDSDQQSDGESEKSDSESESDQQNSEQSDSEEGDPTERAEDEDQQKDLDALQEELERAADAQQNSESEQQLTEEQLEELRRAQEEQQAMEQWLRRIPNDPGGLLRRKFRYQYQRLGKDQDGNDLWPDDEVQPW